MSCDLAVVGLGSCCQDRIARILCPRNPIGTGGISKLPDAAITAFIPHLVCAAVLYHKWGVLAIPIPCPRRSIKNGIRSELLPRTAIYRSGQADSDVVVRVNPLVPHLIGGSLKQHTRLSNAHRIPNPNGLALCGSHWHSQRCQSKDKDCQCSGETHNRPPPITAGNETSVHAHPSNGDRQN